MELELNTTALSPEKIDKLIETYKNQISLLGELKQSLIVEEYRKVFPNAKLCVGKVSDNGKIYEMTYLKLSDNNLTVYLSEYLLMRELYGEDSHKMKTFCRNYGNITSHDKEVLKLFKVIGVIEK